MRFLFCKKHFLKNVGIGFYCRMVEIVSISSTLWHHLFDGHSVPAGDAADMDNQLMKKILIGEDDPHIQEIFRIMFKSYGYEVECLHSGSELCERKGNWPDAIILDKQLPGIGGLEVCRIFKSRDETKGIPIIMISASNGIGPLAAKAGADDFIEKPFNMHIILNKVFNILKQKQAANA